MDLDALLRHYFGTDDPAAIDVEALASGKARISMDFARETELGRRFIMWVLMDGLDIAPPPAIAFAGQPALRGAAEDYLTAAWRTERG